MDLKRLAFPFIQRVVRRARPARLDDTRRNEPVSKLFGSERGQPIDRYYIERFVARQTEHIRGRALEVASSDYIRRYHCGATSFEVLHVDAAAPGATIIGDLAQWQSLPEARVDSFVCTQTFNFVYDVHAAVRGAHRLLAPGGTLVATLAGLTQISRYDMDRWGDFWRFTSASAARLFGEHFARVEVVTFGNVLAAKALIDGLAVEDLPDASRLDELDPDYQVVIGVVAHKGG
jgi:Methyltransferase domain